MDRILKFRAWTGKEMKTAFDLSQNPKYWWEDNKDYPLMQFAGLKDKNGKEIYEGDIVKGGITLGYRNRKGIVEFKDGHFTFTEIWQEGLLIESEENPDALSVYSELEVLGNMYENGALMYD